MIFNAVGGCVNPYPVGAIYLSAASTSPASLFGGTWERLKDRFLLGAGDTYTAGSTGGEANHKLSMDEMPAHNHGMNIYAQKTGTGGGVIDYYSTAGGPAYSTFNQGGDQPHNNMPPYLTVYMWKRVA